MTAIGLRTQLQCLFLINRKKQIFFPRNNPNTCCDLISTPGSMIKANQRLVLYIEDISLTRKKAKTKFCLQDLVKVKGQKLLMNQQMDQIHKIVPLQ